IPRNNAAPVDTAKVTCFAIDLSLIRFLRLCRAARRKPCRRTDLRTSAVREMSVAARRPAHDTRYRCTDRAAAACAMSAPHHLPTADEGGPMKKAIAALTMAAALSVPAMAHDHDTLVRFEGGIGVIPASAAAGPANADGSFPN